MLLIGVILIAWLSYGLLMRHPFLKVGLSHVKSIELWVIGFNHHLSCILLWVRILDMPRNELRLSVDIVRFLSYFKSIRGVLAHIVVVSVILGVEVGQS